MMRCQYEMLELHVEYAKNGRVVGTRVRPAGLCSTQPVKGTDWCEKHAYVHEMLQASISAGCPEMVITTVYNWDTKKQEPALIVGKGLDNWQAYAPRHQEERHDSVMEKLKAIKAEKDRQDKTAIEKAAQRARNAA